MGLSDLFRKLANASEKLERLELDADLKESINFKLKNCSEHYGCNGKKYHQKNIVVISDLLDIKVVDSCEGFSVSVYLSDNSDVDLVSLSLEESKDDTLKIKSRCLQQNSHGFILIKGFTGHSLKISSKHGDIELDGIDVDNTDLRTGHGDIEIEDVDFKRVNIDTENGDINVAINGEAKIDVLARYGDVDIDDAMNNPNSDRELICRSRNGDIVIKSK